MPTNPKENMQIYINVFTALSAKANIYLGFICAASQSEAMLEHCC